MRTIAIVVVALGLSGCAANPGSVEETSVGNPPSGIDMSMACSAGETLCTAGGGGLMSCSVPAGQWVLPATPCAIKCVASVDVNGVHHDYCVSCEPGAVTCDGSGNSYRCNGWGSAWVPYTPHCANGSYWNSGDCACERIQMCGKLPC
jgi:hypothetical protein